MNRLLRKIAALMLLLGVLCAGTALASSLGRVIFQKNSLYHRIFVYRDGSVVSLRFGKRSPLLVQSQVDLAEPRRHVHEYTSLAFSGLLYRPQPRRMLLVGLGGGVIPREMRHYFPQMQIDVVEIDPEIPRVAKRFFRFQTDERLRVHIADGRVFVKRLLRRDQVPKYDLILLDACNSDYIPFHLMTVEYLEELKGILQDGGVIVSNCICTNSLADAQLKTFMAAFENCQVYMGRRSTNAMLVAPGPALGPIEPKEALRRAGQLQEKHGFPFDIRGVARCLRPDVRPDAQAPVLTDDRAPVNRLRQDEGGGLAGD